VLEVLLKADVYLRIVEGFFPHKSILVEHVGYLVPENVRNHETHGSELQKQKHVPA